jgi:glycolate oxidase
MALAGDVYQALEEVVGPENISDEPVILDSYAFQWLGELMPGARDRFVRRPAAVVLPGSTGEVQAVVKICHKYQIKFKSISTGWGVYGMPGSEDIIQLDLRRMNRVLEINEGSMYAVVEPYVTGAQLQAELMKRGLNCNLITGGSSVSALPVTAMSGDGFSSVSTGMSGRNTLGVEWVLPTGEILRLGSLGSGTGWFCGDGPGPSLRGIIRGIGAVAGGLGVFTRAATKVYHWPGPPVPAIEGVSPSYTAKSLPQIHCYYPLFPSWEKLAEAGAKVAESEIAYILCAVRKHALAADIATSNEEGARLYTEILKLSEGRPGMLVVINANSPREFAYQERVLRKILAETGGECLSLLEDERIQEGMKWRFTRVSAGPRQYFRFTGANTIFCRGLTNQYRIPLIRGGEANQAREEHVRKGLTLYDDGDDGSSLFIEYGHMGFSSLAAYFDLTDDAARQAVVQLSEEENRLGLEKYKCLPSVMSASDHDTIGPMQCNYQQWLRQIKRAFDPDVTSDPTGYIQP